MTSRMAHAASSLLRRWRYLTHATEKRSRLFRRVPFHLHFARYPLLRSAPIPLSEVPVRSILRARPLRQVRSQYGLFLHPAGLRLWFWIFFGVLAASTFFAADPWAPVSCAIVYASGYWAVYWLFRRPLLVELWRAWPAPLEPLLPSLVQDLKISWRDRGRLRESPAELDRKLSAGLGGPCQILKPAIARLRTLTWRLRRTRSRNGSRPAKDEELWALKPCFRALLIKASTFFSEIIAPRRRLVDAIFADGLEVMPTPGHLDDPARRQFLFLRVAMRDLFRERSGNGDRAGLELTRFLFYWAAPVWLGFICLLLPLLWGILGGDTVEPRLMVFPLFFWLVLSVWFYRFQLNWRESLMKFDKEELDYTPRVIEDEILAMETNKNHAQAPDVSFVNLLTGTQAATVGIYMILIQIVAPPLSQDNQSASPQDAVIPTSLSVFGSGLAPTKSSFDGKLRLTGSKAKQ